MKNIKQQFEDIQREKQEEVQQDPWRLKYHLMPPVGWLNDPNGLCQFQDVYHIFYQYAPLDAEGKALKGWGHYTTKDFIHYCQEPIALFPDQPIDQDGAYSGCSWVENEKVYFFYTGNIKWKGNYDYINEGRGHYVNSFSSDDGYHFSDKVNLLKNEDYPKDLSCHVRDPKVFQEQGTYYMVLGARTLKSQGCVLIYRSSDLKNWEYFDRLTTPQPFGYMWECPDLFEINHQKILMTCPQGLKQEGYHYENVYANGYFLVNGPITNMSLQDFQELDYGFDFYAPQTFEDQKKRRILIGWLGLPDIPYTNPTVKRGWQHALTLPRELTFKNGHLYQYPIEDILSLKKHTHHVELSKDYIFHNHQVVCECHFYDLPDEWQMKLRDDVQLSYQGEVLTLQMGESGYGRESRHVEIRHINEINIFSDTSSLEIFVNHGEYVLSTRIYDSMKDINISFSTKCQLDIYDMPSFVYLTKDH